MNIRQGDIYWLQASRADGADSGHAHPYVVIQDDVINQSRVPDRGRLRLNLESKTDE